MFDLGLTEIFVIAVIAILVVAPKDLPALMRTIGQTVGKARRMAREFQQQLNDAVRDEELDQLRKQVADLGRETDAEVRRGLYVRDDAKPDTIPGAASLPEPTRRPEMTPIQPTSDASDNGSVSSSEPTPAPTELTNRTTESVVAATKDAKP